MGDVWGHAGSAPLRMDHYRNVDNTMRNSHDSLPSGMPGASPRTSASRFTVARDGVPVKRSSTPI